jgi:hypothetical protein
MTGTVSYIVPRPGPRRIRTPELIARCVMRYQQGMSLIDIGMMEGCGGNAIKSILGEAGITPRSRGATAHSPVDSFRYSADRRRHNLQPRDAA